MYISIINFGKTQENNMSSDYKITYIIRNDTIIDNHYNSKLLKHPKIDGRELYRIISQLEMIRARIVAHDNALTFLFTNFYFFIVLQAILTFITISLGLYLSKVGWDNIHKNLLIMFFVISGLMIFSRMIPDSMKFKDNINNNKERIILYKNLESRIHTYISTCRLNGKIVNTNEFINFVDTKIIDYNDISFEIDEVPSNQYRQEAIDIQEDFK